MASAEVIDDVRLITILSFSVREITNKYPDLMLKFQNIIQDRNISNEVINKRVRER